MEPAAESVQPAEEPAAEPAVEPAAEPTSPNAEEGVPPADTTDARGQLVADGPGKVIMLMTLTPKDQIQEINQRKAKDVLTGAPRRNPHEIGSLGPGTPAAS